MRINKIPILMYHSIEKMPKGTPLRSLHVSPNLFKIQMLILKILGYKGLSMGELEPYLLGEKKGKVVGITFDDGYQNIAKNALNILKKNNFSATCFIVANHIAKNNSWDIKKGLPKLNLMNSSEVKNWINSGMEIGSHTLNHPDLTNCSPKELQNEILDSKNKLEKKFNVCIKHFCYPYGRFNTDVINSVKKFGYFSATTVKRGRAQSYSDLYTLPRVTISHRTYPHLFILKILSSYEEGR